jgi:undecaprenyl-diphosphatase
MGKREIRAVSARVASAVRSAFDRIAGTDLLALVAVVAALVGSWAFVEIADEVAEGETRAVDAWVVRSLRRASDPAAPVGPRWLADDVRDLSALGGRAVLLLVTAAVVLYLWLARTYHAMWLVLGAAVGGQLLSAVLKAAFARPRPDVVPHLAPAAFSSFPSGHSTSAAAVYLTLGLLLAQLTDRMRLRLYALSLAALVTVLVGASRIYLGVHYPTDVLAGWAAGSAWAACCWLVAGFLQRRGAIEARAEGAITSLGPPGARSNNQRPTDDAPRP